MSYNFEWFIDANIASDVFLRKPLPPLLKWPGGKTSEFSGLKGVLPLAIRNYYEPFLGGGAIWLATLPTQPSFVNDICEDLMDFYRHIQKRDPLFFESIQIMSAAWDYLSQVAIEQFRTIYTENLTLDPKDLAPFTLLGDATPTVNRTLRCKIQRVRFVEKHAGSPLTDDELRPNVESALKAAYYTYVRETYNKHQIRDGLRSAAFYFLRDYCFSSMFRSGSHGFNVPYGGLSYNARSPAARVETWLSEPVQEKLARATFRNKDFEGFLDEFSPGAEDFLFVDPPYDSTFSTYAGNTFDQADQRRLADYLIRSKAQFLAVVKSTEFTRDLYMGHESKGIQVHSQDKSYAVSFRDRNDRKTQHLLVYRTN